MKASQAMAETDQVEMNNYKSIIKNVARQKGVDPALIAAIISRSCRAGKTLTGGWGYYDEKRQKYNTYGLMQVIIKQCYSLLLSGVSCYSSSGVHLNISTDRRRSKWRWTHPKGLVGQRGTPLPSHRHPDSFHATHKA